MPEIVFVVSERQNLFWVEIIEALRTELETTGVRTSVSTDGFPAPREDLAFALVPPHEWFTLEVGRRKRPAPSADLLRRTLFLCGEQPGTSHFDENAALARQAGAVFDINRGAARELERRGVAAAHFQLGYTSEWDRSPDTERDVDVLFLGAFTPRRSQFVSSYADSIWRKDCRVVFSDNSQPNWKPSGRFLTGDEKWTALGRAKTLLNIHQGGVPYFEWARAIQVLTNGCVLVNEESTDYAPLEPGAHFISGRPESLALHAHRLLEDDELRRTIQRHAYEFIRDQLPLRDAAEEFATAAEAVARTPIGRRRHELRPSVDDTVESAPGETDLELAGLRRAMKQTALELLDLRRTMQRFHREYSLGGGFPLVEVVRESRAYSASQPRVSIITSLYNQGEYVGEALGSVAGGRYRSFEVIVVDDASTDQSLDRAKDWIDAHESAPALLLHHPVNQGLPHARNTAVDFARGEFVFILDADNLLYPNGLERLVAALDANPHAAFAYGLHQRFSADGPEGVANCLPWEPRRFRAGNYIDAMALIRTETLRELGGYTTDIALYGWEDFDLWCRIAEAGHDAVFVPQFVARYRVLDDSMLSLTNLSSTHAFAVLAKRYPKVMGGAQAPV